MEFNIVSNTNWLGRHARGLMEVTNNALKEEDHDP
jgi:hypothetical protein